MSCLGVWSIECDGGDVVVAPGLLVDCWRLEVDVIQRVKNECASVELVLWRVDKECFADCGLLLLLAE